MCEFSTATYTSRHPACSTVFSASGRIFPDRDGTQREVISATSGKAELAVPTLAIAEVPVAELPVRDRLLLWENSQLVEFKVEDEATLKSERKDAAQPEATDPYAGGVLTEN